MLDGNLAALVTESYNRAYYPLVMVQQCAELEEIIEYKRILLEISSLPRNRSGSDYAPLSNSPHQSGSGSAPRRASEASYDGDETAGLATDGSMSINQALLQEARQKKIDLSEKWRKRLRGCRSTGRAAIPVWKSILSVRRMILSEKEDLDTWLEFVSLCSAGDNYKLAERLLNFPPSAKVSENQRLIGFLESGAAGELSELSMDRRIQYAKYQQQWSSNNGRLAALQGLENLCRSMDAPDAMMSYADADVHRDCLLRLGKWKLYLLESEAIPIDPVTRHTVLDLYGKATLVDPHSYRAWHEWGLANFRAVEEARNVQLSWHNPGGVIEKQGSYSEDLAPYILNAAKGLLRAISLGSRRWSSSITQDMLSVLSIWFRYSKVENLIPTLEQCLLHIHIDNWLGVLPQLIARIDHPEASARKVLHNLLSRLGTKHAQVLVYPLSVALKSPIEDRQGIAEGLINTLRQHSPSLIDQFLTVSNELVRVAILWAEDWHECLEEASRQYYGEGNIKAMLDTLLPLHSILRNGAATMREASFVQAYGADLTEAYDCLSRYQHIMANSRKPIPTAGAMPATKRKKGALGPEEACLVKISAQFFECIDSLYNATF